MASILSRLRTSTAAAGGRFNARRRIVVWTLGLAMGVLVGGPTGALANDQQVSVSEADGVYRITAQFTAPVSPAVGMAVLTDYDSIPRILPNVRTSRLLERANNHALVEQQAIVRLMLFSTRIHLLLGIEESTSSLRFVDRSGKSFDRYEGAWTLCERDGRLEITYELTAKPTFDAPAFVIRRLMQRDASDQIRRLRAEMVARAGRH